MKKALIFMAFVAAVMALVVAVFLAVAPSAAATDPLGTREVTLKHKINTVRIAHGMNTLRVDVNLNEAASYWTNRMASNGRLYHGSFLIRLVLFEDGLTCATYGEVIAVGYPTATGVLAAWMRSPTHRAVILGRHITYIGLDARLGVYRGVPAYYWVVDVHGRFDQQLDKDLELLTEPCITQPPRLTTLMDDGMGGP